MNNIVFDDICRIFECKHYVEWNRDDIYCICVSCTKVGQSYNITKYPDDCPYRKNLEMYAIEQEQDKIWKRLNAID